MYVCNARSAFIYMCRYQENLSYIQTGCLVESRNGIMA